MADRDGDDKTGPFSRFAGGGDNAAVAVGNATADGQADAGAFIFVAAMQALKDGKDFVEILFFEPDAVVLDGDLALFGVGILVRRPGKRTLENAGVDFDHGMAVGGL